MNYRVTKNFVSIPREVIRRNGGVVVLDLEEYRRLQEQVVPTYQLYGKEAEELDKLVEEGLRDYREGKCRKVKSLADLD